MPGQHVAVCHRSRLFGECLASSLMACCEITCTSLAPHLAASTALTSNGSSQAFELLLLDVSLPEGLSERLAEQIRQGHPECKILLMISETAISRIVDLARLGSHGCIFEEVSLENVRQAIDLVMSGKSFYSPELANALFAQLGKTDNSEDWGRHIDNSKLTAREREVLELITYERLSNKQIARRLGVSLYTIKNHVHSIIETMGVSDRHEAAELARQRKLVLRR